jgi:hypothetical protein
MTPDQIFGAFVNLIHREAYWIPQVDYVHLLERMKTELELRLAPEKVKTSERR